MKRYRSKICLSIALLLLFISVHASASTVFVEDITLSMPGTMFYTGGAFALNDAPAATAVIRLFDALEYDYRIDNAVVSFTPRSLQWTNPTGTRAEGEFAGGAILTVTGDLVDDNTEDVYFTGITIFQAEMVIPSSESWTLIEDAFVPSRFGASLDFVPIDGGLNAGITAGDNELRLDDFNCGISATMVQPYNPNNFNVPFMLGSTFDLQITAVPEPCTILLMSFGGIALLRNRKK